MRVAADAKLPKSLLLLLLLILNCLLTSSTLNASTIINTAFVAAHQLTPFPATAEAAAAAATAVSAVAAATAAMVAACSLPLARPLPSFS